MALGSPLPTSSAWVGPQSTTTGQLASSLLPHGLAQPFGGAVLNPLGHADHHSAGLYDITDLPGGGAHGKGGRRQHNQRRSQRRHSYHR